MASNPQHEPTMEEILASIRKIISEDSSEPPPPAPVERPLAAVHVEADTDVLELTQEVVEEPAPRPVPPPAPEPVRVVQAVPSPAPVPKPENDVVFQTIEEPPVSSPANRDTRFDAHDDIFTDRTRQATHEAFAAHEPEPVEDVVSHAAFETPKIDGQTVEAVFERAVRENFGQVATEYLHTNEAAFTDQLKAMLRDWLEANFPALVERAVRAEIARIVDDRFETVVQGAVARAMKTSGRR